MGRKSRMKKERRKAKNNLNKHQKELIEGPSRADFEMMGSNTELLERLLKSKVKKEDAMMRPEAYVECVGCGWTEVERGIDVDNALEKAVELYDKHPFCPHCLINAEMCIGLGVRPTVVMMATNLFVER